MIQYQLKLKLTPRQERQLTHWFYHLTAVWNWAIKRVERDAEIGVYYSSITFRNLLNGHGGRGHEFTPENTMRTRNGRGRNCKTCNRIHQKNYDERRCRRAEAVNE